MIKFLLATNFAFLFGVAIVASMMLFAAFNIKKEYRYKHSKHIIFLIGDILVGAVLYIGVWIAMQVNGKAKVFLTDISAKHLIPILVLVVYLLLCKW